MRYPAECPVFEVVGGHPYGDVDCFVVGCGIVNGTRGPIEACGVGYSSGEWSDGQPLTYFPDELRPLTPAARAMLALVTP